MYRKVLSSVVCVYFSASVSASAQSSINTPGGTINISETGRISGTLVDEVPTQNGNVATERTNVVGSISESGVISGSFSGTDEFHEFDTDGSLTVTTDSFSGTFSGTIDSNGNYSVSWSGPEPGSQSGKVDNFASQDEPEEDASEQNQPEEDTSEQNQPEEDTSEQNQPEKDTFEGNQFEEDRAEYYDKKDTLGEFDIVKSPSENPDISDNPKHCGG